MKNIYVILFSLIAFIPAAFSQPVGRVTPKVMLEIADEEFEKKNYYTALEWYEKYTDEVEEPELEVSYKIAQVQYILRDFRQAERDYKRVIRKIERLQQRKERKPSIEIPNYPDIRFTYARILKMNEKYDEAIEQFQRYITEEAEEPTMVRLAKSEITGAEMGQASMDIPGLEVNALENEINSPFTEYSPYISGDGQSLYYSSFSRDDIVVLDGKEGSYHSKVYMAKKADEGWAAGSALSDKINRENYHSGNATFSEDGNTMYFTRSLLEGNSLNKSIIYYSQRGSDGWMGARALEGQDTSYINRHPMPGELYGKEVLFFVSDRPGGFGGLDIYYAPFIEEGELGEAVNLGKVINTLGDEATPFYIDGTLFFSSTGHAGLGGYDIFETTWDGSKWSEPLNLGKGLNSSVDDLYYTADEKGLNGFLVSNRPSKNSLKSKTCCDDIYEFTRPEIIAGLLADVVDNNGKPLRGANLSLLELTNDEKELLKEKTNPNGNTFEFGLELEKAFMVYATKEGYFPDSFTVNTVGLIESANYEHTFNLLPIPVPEPEYDTVTVTINEPIRLSKIYYDFDDDKILAEAEEDLADLLNLLNEYPEMVIELSSHTDSRGRNSYNQQLSQRRANSAKNWLVDKGIDTERIKAVGYGESQILNQCTDGVECTDEEHRFNRRTEFKILEGPTTITIKQTKIEKIGEEEEGEEESKD